MSATSLFDQALAEHTRLFSGISTLAPALEQAAIRCAASIQSGGKLLFCGNGGSAGDAQHLAAELVGRLVRDRRALPGLALSTDSSALTCIGNDFGFDEIFARQVQALCRQEDVLIAISTSGNSPNVIRAAQAATDNGAYVIGLLGRDGGKLVARVDLPLIVASNETARIQEAHIFLGHVLCAQIESQLGIGGWNA